MSHNEKQKEINKILKVLNELSPFLIKKYRKKINKINQKALDWRIKS